MEHRFPYRPSLKLFWAIGFFVLCGGVLTAKAIETGVTEDWLIAGACWVFVAAGCFGVYLGRSRSGEVVINDASITVPIGRWRPEPHTFRLDELAAIKRTAVQTNEFLQVTATDERSFVIQRDHLPSPQVFEQIAAFLQTGGWGDIEDVLANAPRIAPAWMLLAVKIGALLSFCGGPLYVMDVLKPTLGTDLAFAVGFAPLAVMIFGTLAAVEDEAEGFSLFVVRAGGIAAGIIVLESIATVWALVSGLVRADAGLLMFGSVVSFGAAALYAHLWRMMEDRKP